MISFEKPSRRSLIFVAGQANVEFSGEFLSQMSRAKVKIVRLIFATRRGPESGPQWITALPAAVVLDRL